MNAFIKNIKHYSFKKEIKYGFEIRKLSDFLRLNRHLQLKTPHLLEFYAILFITKGNGIHEIDFRDYTYHDNTILFVRNNQVHAWKKFDRLSGYLILFTEEFLHNNQVRFKDLSYTYPYNTSLHYPLLALENEQNIKAFRLLVSVLYEEYLLDESAKKPEILQCLLQTFLLKVQSKKTKVYSRLEAGRKLLFIKFQKLLNERISKSRNVNDYCKWLQVSYRNLNETCKSLTGKTAKSFIDDFIMIQARQMLIHSRQNISQVAYGLSFEEPTNFTKFFKKHTGTTPKQFQKSINQT